MAAMSPFLQLDWKRFDPGFFPRFLDHFRSDFPPDFRSLRSQYEIIDRNCRVVDNLLRRHRIVTPCNVKERFPVLIDRKKHSRIAIAPGAVSPPHRPGGTAQQRFDFAVAPADTVEIGQTAEQLFHLRQKLPPPRRFQRFIPLLGKVRDVLFGRFAPAVLRLEIEMVALCNLAETRLAAVTAADRIEHRVERIRRENLPQPLVRHQLVEHHPRNLRRRQPRRIEIHRVAGRIVEAAHHRRRKTVPRNRVERRLTETLRPVHNLHIVEAIEPHHLAQTRDRIQRIVPERFVQFETVCRRLRLLLRLTGFCKPDILFGTFIKHA